MFFYLHPLAINPNTIKDSDSCSRFKGYGRVTLLSDKPKI